MYVIFAEFSDNQNHKEYGTYDSFEQAQTAFERVVKELHSLNDACCVCMQYENRIVRQVDAISLHENRKMQWEYAENLKQEALSQRANDSKRVIQKTIDGSHTLYVYELDEHYHSTNGAIQEAMHIYIEKAFNHSQVIEPIVFEVGFGTGLNTLLTALEAQKKKRKTQYISIEKYPLNQTEVEQLNYVSLLGKEASSLFSKIHDCAWNEPCKISEYFELIKYNADLTLLPQIPQVDVIYFDAFAPNKQASMWTETIFSYLFDHTNKNGILTTYCAQGNVRRTLQKVGYSVERTDGPYGKREMLRATKL